MNRDENVIDISPKTSIYKTFKNYSYTPKTAISELFDNSTASFIQHWNELNKEDDEFIPCINLNFLEITCGLKQEYEIWVTDNAFGIDKENINRVLQVQNRPKNTNGRNEFGMGLKAAGFWFGDRIDIWTKSMDEKNAIRFEFDLDEVINSNESTIEKKFISNYEFMKYSGYEYGTVVRFSKIPKGRRISKFSDLLKIVEHLTNTYYKDINDYKLQIRITMQNVVLNEKTGNVKSNQVIDLNRIYENPKINEKFNSGKGVEEQIKNIIDEFLIQDINEASVLSIKKPKFYLGKYENFTNDTLFTKNLDFSFIFNEKEYRVTGVVGILDSKYTGRENGGFILLRRGRVIIGGSKKEYYRPKEILGNPSGFVYQRIFGELNLDNFPATQSKDKFDWDNGLESKFIEELKSQIESPNMNLIVIANGLRFRTDQSKLKIYDNKYLKNILDKTSIENVEQDVRIFSKEDNKESYWFTFKNKINGKCYGYEVELANVEGNETNKNNWMEVLVNNATRTKYLNQINESNADYSFLVKLDLSSPIFSPINDNKEFLQINIAIWVKLAYAETIHANICSNASQIRNIISQEIKKEK